MAESNDPRDVELTTAQKEALARVDKDALSQVQVGYKRPGVLTFIGWVLFLKAALTAVTAIAIFVQRDDAAFQQTTGQGADALLWTGIIEAAFAVVFVLLGSAIMSGARWARTAVAIVYVLRLGVAGWYLVTHIGGGLQWNILLQAAIAIWVLWALYGNDESERYFGDVVG